MTAVLSAYPPAVWALLLGTSVLIGLLAGFLGVGGGIVAVPVLLDVFSMMGLGEANAVVLAVGTAQASILVASLSAVLAHWRAGTIDGPLVRAWLPALFAGTLLGLVLSVFAPRSCWRACSPASPWHLPSRWPPASGWSSPARPCKGCLAICCP